ncbi:hypothetical protein K0H71_21905 [Bacillus sp. IITD106]|nr:hypothetical protein [Bacillus sp. IITD106]
MKDIEKWLHIYSGILDTLSLSPFELHYALSIRDELEKQKNQLTPAQRYLLMKYDYQVIIHAKELAVHLEEIFVSTQNNKPESQWWWHWDSISDQTLNLGIHLERQSM